MTLLKNLMAPPLSVLVVIVNYRTPSLVVECLRSLKDEVLDHPGAQVMVVDNDSRDGSPDYITNAISSEGWSSWARVLSSPINGGFSFGNNFAIRTSLSSELKPDCFWLLNPDTIVLPGALKGLTTFLTKNPEAGICGGGINEQDNTPWPFAFRFPSIISELERGLGLGLASRLLKPWMVRRQMLDVPERVDWVCGASMMVRSEVFQRVGLMDEDYFLYFEETDFCLKAQRAGYQCWYVPESRVVHIAGQSTGVTSKTTTPKRLPGYWFDSRRRYFVKNHGRVYAMLTDLVWMLAFTFGRFRRWLQRKPDNDPPHYLADFFRNSSIRKSSIRGGVLSEKS